MFWPIEKNDVINIFIFQDYLSNTTGLPQAINELDMDGPDDTGIVFIDL